MKAFTLIESLIVIAIIAALIGIGTASYRRLKWTADGKFKSQKRVDEERVRLKRQTEIGLKQGK